MPSTPQGQPETPQPAPKPNPKPAAKPAVKEQVIQFHSSKRIHPKRAIGKFANLRVLMIVATQLFFYGMPWIMWHGRQAVLFNIEERHFYLFSMVLEPADMLYLAGLMIVSAFGLFWWTTIAGRLWCGYSCPQTVYTEIMLWIDHLVEGDRNKRLKLDKEPWNFHKIRIKALKYLVIFIVAAWTGITFSGWFVPIRQFVPAIFAGTAGSVALGTAAFYGFVTWLFGHILREKVCLHMCPYARFQSAMFDHDTLVISYDVERGEPRGARKKNASKEDTQLGDCINCTMCVQVCPTGIDIRDGLQYQCMTQRLLRPKVVGYGVLLLVAVIGLCVGLATRATVQIDVIKDRGVMVRENKEGLLENSYNLSISNASEQTQIIQASVSGLDDIRLTGLPENGISIKGGDIITIPVQVATQPEYAEKGSHPIQFTFKYRVAGQPENEARVLQEKSIFIGE